ncbi:MAG: hypothetical protein APF83_06415 [Lutibacter sp. BRH_c52]|nr:MAG: hypothetical protein APF83_06415 [Lutibacter sp. BRH_c52]
MINNFIAFDFETANGKYPCSIGIVEFENGEIINEYYSLIRPKELVFNPIASKIHGLCISDVINEREFFDVWKDISHFFDNKIVVAHNHSFDISVLNYSLEIYGIEKPVYEVYCTLELSRTYLNIDNHKLSSVAKFFKIDQNNYHNALEDAFVCGKVFLGLMNYAKSHEKLEINNFQSVLSKKDKNNSWKQTENVKRDLIFESEILTLISNNLEGKHFVISGVFKKFYRDELKKSIEDNGGKVASSISKKTDFIVAGENMGPSKREKAENLGIPMISETDYLKMLG